MGFISGSRIAYSKYALTLYVGATSGAGQSAGLRLARPTGWGLFPHPSFTAVSVRAQVQISKPCGHEKNQNLSADYLAGKWRVTAFYLNTNLGWKLTKQYGLNSFLWEFDRDGKLLEKRKDKPDFHTYYILNISERELLIDRSGFEKGDTLSLNCRYLIEFINENECYLYDMENIDVEPQNYRYRMKIKRLV